MPVIILHPVHDDTGRMWPERDYRWVTQATMQQYERCGAWKIWHRTQGGIYGRIGSHLLRRRPMPMGKTCKIIEYCPGAIWHAYRWGRWQDPTFDPKAPIRLYECDPAKTAERQRVKPSGEYPPEIQQILAQQSGALMQALAIIKTLSPNLINPASEPIAFTR